MCNNVLQCWPELSPQIVGTKELVAGDPITLKASMVHCPPASKVVPAGPDTVKVSKSSRRKQMSGMEKKGFVAFWAGCFGQMVKVLGSGDQVQGFISQT